jgi:hypothetical protein
MRGVPEGKVSILGGHSIAHCKQIVYMYVCPILSGFKDRAISLHSSKIFVSTVSNTSIYFSSDKIGTVYIL